MKRTLLIILCLFSFLLNLKSEPNLVGSNGILKIFSAESEKTGYFQIAIHCWGTYEKLKANYISLKDNNLKETMDDYCILSTFLGTSYNISDTLAIRLTSTFYGDQISTNDIKKSGDRSEKPYSSYFGTKDLMSTELGDTQISLEFSYPGYKKGCFFIALKPFISLPTGSKRGFFKEADKYNMYRAGGIFRYFTSQNNEWGIITPISFVSERAKYHFNLGYYDRLGKETLADQISLGLGAEFPITKSFSPFVEWTRDTFINDKNNLLGGVYSVITAGFRVIQSNGMNFDLAYDWRLSPEINTPSTLTGDELKINSGWAVVPKWAAHCTLMSYSYREPLSTLIIQTTDAKTGEPLEAELSFSGERGIVKTFRTNADTGILNLKNLPETLVEIGIYKEGYLKQAESIELKKGGIINKVFKLASIEQEIGALAGKIFDAKTKKTLEAEVSFPESNLKTIITNQTGTFKIENFPTGILVVEINKEGYLKSVSTIAIKKQETTIKDFELIPIEKEIGSLIGRVVDIKTGEIIEEAVISFPSIEGLKSLFTKDGIGTYKIENIPTGILDVEVNKSGYVKQSASVVIKKGEISIKDFEMRPVSKTIITGKVTDKKTGNAVMATVYIDDMEGVMCNENGIYKIVISSPLSTYTITASAEKYISQSFPLIMEEGKITEKNFVIVKKGEKIKLEGIYFDSGKATIKPESRPSLEKASLFLKENSRMKVEIQGHTDSTGADDANKQLSENRALSVKKYLVEGFGVSAEQMIIRGCGESMPVDSNSTKEGRALNRRIEFLILGDE
ncbi:MAG: OmpA family protein [bacterium]